MHISIQDKIPIIFIKSEINSIIFSFVFYVNFIINRFVLLGIILMQLSLAKISKIFTIRTYNRKVTKFCKMEFNIRIST